MKTTWIKLVFTLILIFTLTACTATPVQPTVDPSALGTIVAQNVQLTQMAGTLTAVIAQESATPKPSNTPQATATLAQTPTETLTPTPLTGVWLLLDQDTNCRVGPGTYYPSATTIEAGNKLEALARSEDGEFFYVRYFDTSNIYCWMWKGASYISGNQNAIPVFTAQPTKAPSVTPTSLASFTVSYNSMQVCSGKYVLSFNIRNTGNTTWQSVKIVITDNAEGQTMTHTSDAFNGYSNCKITETQGDLTTGEPGLVSAYTPGELTYDPTGHLLGITVYLFSEKGLKGTMQTRSLSVTP